MFDFAVDWNRQSALGWCRWFAEIPQSIRDTVSRFKKRHWHLLSFLAQCGPAAFDLAVSSPATSFAVASNWVFHRPAVRQPLRSARSLLRHDQKVIQQWLGFPPTEATRKLLRKIVPMSIDVSSLLYLRESLSGEDARLIGNRLAHLRRINSGVLRIVTDPELLSIASPNFLAEVSEDGGQDRRPRSAWRLNDVQRMLKIMRSNKPPPVVRNGLHLTELHDSLVDEIDRGGGLENVDVRFPEPPLLGTNKIVPLTDVRSLVEEGREQKNCVASYIGDILRGRVFIYRVISERATLSVVRKGHRWVIGELVASCNRESSDATKRTVSVWMKSAGDIRNK